MAFKKKYEPTEKKDWGAELKNTLNETFIDGMERILANIDQVEKEGTKWEKPWLTMSVKPHNPVTGTEYRGINVFILSCAKSNKGDGRFYTYNNIDEIEKKRLSYVADLEKITLDKADGKITDASFQERFENLDVKFKELESMGLADRTKPMHVRKGEKSVPVYKAIQRHSFGASSSKAETDDSVQVEGAGADGVSCKTYYAHTYAGSVFNASQVENISPTPGRNLEHSPCDLAEMHMAAMQEKGGVKIEVGNATKAYFSPSENKIVLPAMSSFKTVEDFYATAAHELGHSTGIPLKRDLTGQFGSASYGKEELVAEIVSIHMCGEFGLEHNIAKDKQHAAYIRGWLNVVKGENGEVKNDKLILQAVTEAQRSCDYQNAIRVEYMAEKEMSKVLEKSAEKATEQVAAPTIAKPAEKEKVVAADNQPDKPKKKETELTM